MNISLIKDLILPIDSVGLDELDNVRLLDRIDTKYIFSAQNILSLLALLKDHYRILEIDGERIFKYNTTYFDTADFHFFLQHVNDRSERNKVRIRQYENSGISFVEIKRKTKKNRTIKWRLENKYDTGLLNEQAHEFIRDTIGYDSGNLNFVLKNSFKRMTLAGISVPERITIDIDLSFSGPDGTKAEFFSIAIAELKSLDLPSRSPFSKIAGQLYVHPASFSKYCTGASLLYDLPKRNSLKPKLLLLNKMENEYNHYGAA